MCWLLGYGRIEMIENLSTPPNLKIKSVSLFFFFWCHIEKLPTHTASFLYPILQCGLQLYGWSVIKKAVCVC